MRNFADRLRDYMAAERLSCPAVAAAVGVSAETVRSWRVGRRTPCCVHREGAVWAALERLCSERDRAERDRAATA